MRFSIRRIGWIQRPPRAKPHCAIGNIPADSVIGIGVDFTSCTMLPALADGTPLCLTECFAETPLAWPKLWKHHGAKAETDRINQVARERNEPWLNHYGGTIGLEWFWPKVLETFNTRRTFTMQQKSGSKPATGSSGNWSMGRFRCAVQKI